jgi:hypothetical protein
MGNDNEIKQLIRRESESFLNTALVESKGQGKSYDFEAEFAKTGRNRSFVVFGATAITIIILAVAAMAVSRAIAKGIEAAPVDVAAFEDLNLKDILDASKRNESDLERAKTELSRLDYDLQSSLDAADRDYGASVESIKAKGLGKAEQARKLAEAQAARDGAKRRLRADYAVSAAQKRAELAEIQKRIDQYDSRALAQAKEKEATLANERLAFDIEKKTQAQAYEKRIAELERARKSDVAKLTKQRDELAASLTALYNPSFSDERALALLSGWTEAEASQPPAFHEYLSKAGILDADAERELDRSFDDFEFLSSKLKAVPYLNSIPPALSRIEGEARASIVAYRAALQAAGSGLESRDQSIAELKARAEAAENGLAQYRAAVAAYAVQSRESGFVLDPGSAKGEGAKILVSIAPGIEVAEGDSGYVVQGSLTVATIVFHPDGREAFATVSKVEPGMKIRAFDSILVVTPREAAK